MNPIEFKLNEEQQQLVTENHNLIWYFMKYNHLYENDIEDYYGALADTLCHCAYHFKPELGKFSSYVLQSFRNIIANLGRRTNIPVAFSLNEGADSGKDDSDVEPQFPDIESDIEDQIILNMIIKEVYNDLGDKNRKIIDMRLEGYSYPYISDTFGISKQRCHQIFEKFRNDIRVKYYIDKNKENS